MRLRCVCRLALPPRFRRRGALLPRQKRGAPPPSSGGSRPLAAGPWPRPEKNPPPRPSGTPEARRLSPQGGGETPTKRPARPRRWGGGPESGGKAGRVKKPGDNAGRAHRPTPPPRCRGAARRQHGRRRTRTALFVTKTGGGPSSWCIRQKWGEDKQNALIQSLTQANCCHHGVHSHTNTTVAHRPPLCG